MAQDCIGAPESSQRRQHRNRNCDMPSSGVTDEDDMLKVQPELLLSLGNDPHIRLVAVIDRVGVGILRRKTIVNAKYRHTDIDSPLARVALMSS